MPVGGRHAIHYFTAFSKFAQLSATAESVVLVPVAAAPVPVASVKIVNQNAWEWMAANAAKIKAHLEGKV